MTQEGEETEASSTKESSSGEIDKEQMSTSKEESGETNDSTTDEAEKHDTPTDDDEQGATTDKADSAEQSKDAASNGDTETKPGNKSDENAESDEKESSKDKGPAEAPKNDVSEDTVTNTPSKTAEPIPTNEKVKVHFVAVGAAPIMKKTKFQIGADQRFAAVTAFLRKMLKLSGSGSSLFLYCNSAFVPSPDERVGDLSDCFSIRGELVIHYSLQEAWG